MTVGAMGYRLYKPPGVLRSERLPILVMLHGCSQDAEALAVSSRMNQIAARERQVQLVDQPARRAGFAIDQARLHGRFQAFRIRKATHGQRR